jgi:hypothetical protein
VPPSSIVKPPHTIISSLSVSTAVAAVGSPEPVAHPTRSLPAGHRSLDDLRFRHRDAAKPCHLAVYPRSTQKPSTLSIATGEAPVALSSSPWCHRRSVPFHCSAPPAHAGAATPPSRERSQPRARPAWLGRHALQALCQQAAAVMCRWAGQIRPIWLGSSTLLIFL